MIPIVNFTIIFPTYQSVTDKETSNSTIRPPHAGPRQAFLSASKTTSALTPVIESKAPIVPAPPMLKDYFTER